jgi:NAD(P)-dependent dehydrogenase (short-subunit alcohol dehydrogenase family)
MKTFNALMMLSGRRALITGSCGGLGRVIAQTLAELGADLDLLDLKENALLDQATKIKSDWGVDVEIHVCNLESQEEREQFISKLNHRGRLDILVNNAAFVGTTEMSGWTVPFADQSLQSWRRAFEVNLTSAFHLCQGFASLLNETGKGSIINITSIYGEYGPDWSLYTDTSMSNPAAYSASKGGLLQLTRWLATTMAPYVRVNAISPGGIFRNQPEIFIKKYEERTPLKRMAREEDFKGVVGLLASDLSAYVTGQIFSIDGGWGVW